MKTVADIDSEIAAAEERMAISRAKVVERLAKAAEEAGFLGIEVEEKALTSLFRAIVAEIDEPSPNIYARRRQIVNRLQLSRAAAAKRARKTEDRAKLIIGGYLLAQFKRNPEMAAVIAPKILAYVDGQRAAALRAQDRALVNTQIANHAGSAPPKPLASAKSTRATIIIGAWLIAAAAENPALVEAHRAGIDGFISAGATEKGRAADRAAVVQFSAFGSPSSTS